MDNKAGGISSSDMKKWGMFLIFIVLLLSVYLIIKPEGEQEAQKLIVQVEELARRARDAARKSQKPQDLANADLSVEELGKARRLLLESDFSAARNAAEKAKLHALKVVERQAPTNQLRSRIRFKDLAGDVSVRKRFQPEFEAATKQTALEIGDTIKTAATGSCRINYSTRMETILRVESELSFPELKETETGNEPILDLFLENGEIQIKTSELEGSNKPAIITETGKATIYQNTEALIKYRPSSGIMEIRVRFGRVDARSPSGGGNVVKNQLLVIRPGQAAGDSSPLPPAPELTEPANYARFEANQNGFSLVTLSWNPVSATGQYHVELATNDLFNELVHQRNAYIGDSIMFSDLIVGEYFWRVSSIGADDNEGLPSQVRQFEVGASGDTQPTVVRDTKPPKLKVVDVLIQGYIVIVKGRSERDAKVTVEGERAILDDQTGEFKCTLNFHDKGIYTLNVVAVDRAGNRSAEQVKIEIHD